MDARKIQLNEKTGRVCSWRGCLSGQVASFMARLRIWAINEDPDERQGFPAVLGNLLFCEWCTRNRDAHALLSRDDKIWPTIERHFHESGKKRPSRDTVKVEWILKQAPPANAVKVQMRRVH